ncbi:phosphate uptake regulator PhoU [Candidatus Woesearchaeota archaeon]|nr:phosphate uptake regulator PhoU [Candidatus Woesearchaeota archaeon]
MKRSIVKHGPSSFIVSLPLRWIKEHNLNKGDEVDVEEVGQDVIISASFKETSENAELHIKDTKDMTQQVISALYKRGIDEIRIYYDNQTDFQLILNSISQEALGYEIVETNDKVCIVRNITKLTKEFDTILRRIFLVTLSLADEGIKLLQSRNFDALESIVFLEKSNNKFTTFCRRYLNKYSSDSFDKLGPIYFIVELLEKIADQYKYLFEDMRKHKSNKNGKNNNKNYKKMLSYLSKTRDMLRTYYECFYKFDMVKIRQIEAEWKAMDESLAQAYKGLNHPMEYCLYHHARSLLEKTFALVDPLLVLKRH